ARAYQISMQMDADTDLLPALSGLASYHLVSSDLNGVRSLSEQMVRVADKTGDHTHGLTGHMGLGILYCLQSNFEAAILHLNKSISLYNASLHRSLVFQYGHDPYITCLGYLGI